MLNLKSFTKLYDNVSVIINKYLVVRCKGTQCFFFYFGFKATISDMPQQQSMFYIQSTNGQHGILNLTTSGFISAPYQNQLVNTNTPPTHNPHNYSVVFNQPLPTVQHNQALVGPQQALALQQNATPNAQYSAADYYNLAATNNQLVCNANPSALIKASPALVTQAIVPNGNHMDFMSKQQNSSTNNPGNTCMY